MRIPTEGPPISQGGGGPTSPAQRGREEPPLTRGGGEEPPPTRGGRGESSHTQEERRRDRGKEEGSLQNRSKQPTRRSHTSRELRMLDPSENPPPKRARRSTRGTHTKDNSCEVTRESNMICPITCGCRNSLLDIRGKNHVVSHILRATRNILKNELIACFGLTAAMTNKDEISELKLVQLRPLSNQSTIDGPRKHSWQRGISSSPPGPGPTFKGPDQSEPTETFETTQ